MYLKYREVIDIPMRRLPGTELTQAKAERNCLDRKGYAKDEKSKQRIKSADQRTTSTGLNPPVPQGDPAIKHYPPGIGEVTYCVLTREARICRAVQSVERNRVYDVTSFLASFPVLLVWTIAE
jgi:hypothetical protein